MLRCCLISCVLVVLLAPPGRAALTQETVLASLPATVEGNIVNKSVSDVTVRLEAVRSSPLGASDGYTGTVAADGSFRFDDVAPGNYRLVAETPFFLRAQVGSHTPEKPGTVLQIKPGEHLKGLALIALGKAWRWGNQK
jgi:alpha-tubulin suppressor-like RCC1 family protein